MGHHNKHKDKSKKYNKCNTSRKIVTYDPSKPRCDSTGDSYHHDESPYYKSDCNKSEPCDDLDKCEYERCKELVCNTMPYVDYKRYAGKWYEMARLPNTHETSCTSSVVEYKWNDIENALYVTNTCYLDNHNKVTREGVAHAPYSDHPGVLELRFNDKPERFALSDKPERFALSDDSPSAESYYLLHYTDYDHIALVGSIDRKFMWILARNRSINPSSCKRINEMVKLGCRLCYDTCKLIFSY